jgi:Flp pilus assembly CpaF family ATPase
MAKKVARPKKKASVKQRPAGRTRRKEPYDSERITAVVERLREQAGRLGQLARLMDDSRVTDIIVDGHAMLVRGLNQIDNFTDNASRAVREAKSALTRL